MKYKPETAQKFYKCPYCGSKNIAWWEETISTRLYRVKKDGNPYKHFFKKEEKLQIANCGVECLDCNEYANSWSDEFENWIGEKE